MRGRNTRRKQDEEDFTVLDEDEQNGLIAELENQACRQIKTYRNIFGSIFGFLSVMFTLLWIRLMSPVQTFGSLPHENALSSLLSSRWFITFYMYSSLNFGVYSFLLLNGKSAISNPLSLIGNIMTLCTNVYICIYCTSLFWKNHVTNAVMYWIPFVNVLALLLYGSTEFDIFTIISGMEDIKSLKYNVKTV